VKLNTLNDIEKIIKIRDAYIEEIYPNMWLMNNHKWAYFCWEQYKLTHNSNFRFNLIHLDFHWDGINDFQDEERLSKLKMIDSLNKLHELVNQGEFIKDASFIAPGIIRGILKEIHFYCFQDDTEPGIDESLLEEHNCVQYIHNDIDDLITHTFEGDIFFDLDLDLFNKNDYWNQGDIWEENEIIELIDKCSEIISKSSLVTIANSPGYSGTKDDLEYLKNLVIPQIIKYFNE